MAVPPGCTKPDQGGKVSATADSSSERSGVTRRSRHIFSFPNPVDELAARTVAGGVVLMVLLAFALGSPWVLVPIVYGFWARVAAGPTLSPLGQLATRVVVPALPLEPRLTPGPPKRFAQAMGMVLSTAAMLVWVTAGWGRGPVGPPPSRCGGIGGSGLRFLPRLQGLRAPDPGGGRTRCRVRGLRGPRAPPSRIGAPGRLTRTPSSSLERGGPGAILPGASPRDPLR